MNKRSLVQGCYQIKPRWILLNCVLIVCGVALGCITDFGIIVFTVIFCSTYWKAWRSKAITLTIPNLMIKIVSDNISVINKKITVGRHWILFPFTCIIEVWQSNYCEYLTCSIFPDKIYICLLIFVRNFLIIQKYLHWHQKLFISFIKSEQLFIKLKFSRYVWCALLLFV